MSSELVVALEWWSGTECTLYTDQKSYQQFGKESSIVVLNHTYEIDFMCGWNFCDRFGVLGVRESILKITKFALISISFQFLNMLF